VSIMIEDSSSDQQETDRPILMMSMLVVAVFFSMASRAVFSPLMPALQRELGVTLSLVGVLFLIVGVSFAVSMLFSGFLAARIGNGLTIVAALGVITIGLLLSAVSTDVVVLAFGMFLIGSGAGTYPPSGLVMINTKIHVRRRSTALSLHEIGPNLALLLAPLIVLVLEPWLGWRGVLLCMAIVCGFVSLAFFRWGAVDSGVGAAPDLSTIGTILRLRTTYVGMIILLAASGGLHGVYVILPAYLVTEYSLSSQYVNILLVASRVAGVLLLLQTGAIINHFGRRRTIIWALLFSSFFTSFIGLAEGIMIPIVVIGQAAFIAITIPAILSAIADIGQSRYQNITYAVIITVGVSVGGGVIPALLGFLGDMGLGWVGFVVLAGFMVSAVSFLSFTPDFGRDPVRTERS